MKTHLFATALIALVVASGTAAEPDLASLKQAGAEMREAGGEVVSLKVDCDKFTGDEYQQIGGLTSLTSLSISGKNLTDEQLAQLSKLKNLESILINGSQLTDDGYQHFAAFPKLQTLSLFHPSRDIDGFTGAGLAHLKSLPNLRRLTFAGATAGDEAYAAVAKLPQITEFREWHNWETTAGKKLLTQLSQLKSLKLGQRLPHRGASTDSSLNDDAIAAVAEMKSLESLDLMEARLSLEGLARLKALPNLKKLKISLVDLSAGDAKKLQSMLPDVQIDFEPLTEEGEATLVKKFKL